MFLRIAHFTPLPPAQSGIADYGWRVMKAMASHVDAIAVTPTSGGQAPAGIRVKALETLKRSALKGRLCVYQIGNNWLHTGILQHALQHPGVVILHDLQLLYLYEGLCWSTAELAEVMRRSNPSLSLAMARRLAAKDSSPKLPYLMSNMLGDLLESALHVVVHSHYARAVIIRHFGPSFAERVSVVPHFAMPAPPRDRMVARAQLGLAETDFVVLTAGFATRAKQMEVLASVLEPMAFRLAGLRWVHAGKSADGDFDLDAVLRDMPALRRVTRLTGYLPEETLDDYVAACDVLVNLRFPSVGESSGSLARALAAGVCAMVSDTGAYAELPEDVVVHVSALNVHDDLRRKLSVLQRHSNLRQSYGEHAARYAASELSMDAYVEGLLTVLEKAGRKPERSRARRSPAGALAVGPLATTADRFDLMQEAGATWSPSDGRFVENPPGKTPGVYFERRTR